MDEKKPQTKKRNNVRKVYYYADIYEREGEEKGIVFKGQDGSKIYRAGGNEHQQRYIIEQLTKNHGVEEGYKIYQQYNQALLDISDSDVPVKWTFPKASLTLVRDDFESKIAKNDFIGKLGNDTSTTPVRKRTDKSLHY